jgi:putative ABC transport system permease protein
MKTIALSWRYLWSRPLGAALNVLLLSLGLASITFLLLVSFQLSKAFDKDLAGIDVVVGAKGSPMQLIMSGVFHIDVPPGNIPLKAVKALEKNPMVAAVIPMSLGDNLRGFRIVGTSAAYIDHYGAALAQGRLWDAPMQVVVGAIAAKKLGIQVGNTFVGSHGLGGGGHEHADNPYTVVGILQPSGTVIDRLIVTDTASIWHVHEEHANHADGDVDEPPVPEDERQVTMALIRYKTPLAAMSFPRMVNTTTEMQAASPAVEISRLLNMLGIGTDVLRAFAGVLLLTAGLSVFIALWSAVRERRSDLALLRMLGAPPAKIAALLLGEALWLGVLSALIGVAGGQALTALIGWMLQLDNSLQIGGLVWPVELLWVPALACAVSLAAAILPAVGAYRVSVLELLQAR